MYKLLGYAVGDVIEGLWQGVILEYNEVSTIFTITSGSIDLVNCHKELSANIE